MSNYCEICNIELDHKNELQNHLAGKKHSKNVKHKNFEKRMRENSIFVSHIPFTMSPNALIAFLQQYGSIAKYKIGNYYIIIEYANREPVDYLLSNPVYINNCKLNIRRRLIFDNGKKTNGNNSMKNMDPTHINAIIDIFTNEATFDSQFAAFLNKIELKDTEIETSYNVTCLSLNNIFSSIFPNCRTYRFGSTVTGLGLKKCDLDIYMDIGLPIHTVDDEKQPSKVNEQCSNLWTMERIFGKVKSVMYRMSDTFSNITPILKTKTPIIKFCYVPTNISCDISFKNSFGVYNSLLIKHCLSHDIRIRQLMMLIKYLARQCQLTKCGLISNYALILMILFYLQQPEQGIVPPLMEFQKTCEPKFINGWQLNSDENVTLPKGSNNSNIPELLEGFFEFYINFNFKRNIICPLDGIIHSKEEFNDTENLPSCMIRYKEIAMSENAKLSVTTPICIQDPIELNRNVTACITRRLLQSFQAFCKTGSNLCKLSRTDNYKNLLITLLQPVLEETEDLQFVIKIKIDHYLNVGLPDNFDERSDIPDKDQYKKDNLFFTAFNIIKDIFEKVFRLDVEILSADSEAKEQKIEMLSDVHTRRHKQLLLNCKGNISIWLKRKNNGALIDPSISALEQEAIISSEAAEKCTSKENPKNRRLEFTCKFEKEENSVQIQLTFINRNKQLGVYKNFKQIAMTWVPKITVKTLMHMLQFKKSY